jgi:hypothetical protein
MTDDQVIKVFAVLFETSACGPHCSRWHKTKEFAAGVCFAEDQHPVQTLATHRANQTLNIRILS